MKVLALGKPFKLTFDPARAIGLRVPPLHGGGQGFESPSAPLVKNADLQVERKMRRQPAARRCPRVQSIIRYRPSR